MQGTGLSGSNEEKSEEEKIKEEQEKTVWFKKRFLHKIVYLENTVVD